MFSKVAGRRPTLFFPSSSCLFIQLTPRTKAPPPTRVDHISVFFSRFHFLSRTNESNASLSHRSHWTLAAIFLCQKETTKFYGFFFRFSRFLRANPIGPWGWGHRKGLSSYNFLFVQQVRPIFLRLLFFFSHFFEKH